MLLGKRRITLEDDHLPLKKRHFTYQHSQDVKFHGLGPIPITSFDPSVFPRTSMVTVFVSFDDTTPSVTLEPIVPLPQCSFSQDTMPTYEDTMPTYEDPVPTYDDPVPTCVQESFPIPFFEEEEGFRESPISLNCDVGKMKSRVVYGNKHDVKHILNLLDVPVYASNGSPTVMFTPGMMLNSIPESMNKKKTNVTMLLNNCQTWHGVGVLTLAKDDKNQVCDLFRMDITDIAQYVRPLGFAPGELVLPSNAICYKSYKKGQVTYMLTHLLRYADVCRCTSGALSKKKKKESNNNSDSGRRFSYGMTILKDRTHSLDVQFCLLTLLAYSESSEWRTSVANLSLPGG
jgi:hypothetical protein